MPIIIIPFGIVVLLVIAAIWVASEVLPVLLLIFIAVCLICLTIGGLYHYFLDSGRYNNQVREILKKAPLAIISGCKMIWYQFSGTIVSMLTIAALLYAIQYIPDGPNETHTIVISNPPKWKFWEEPKTQTYVDNPWRTHTKITADIVLTLSAIVLVIRMLAKMDSQITPSQPKPIRSSRLHDIDSKHSDTSVKTPPHQLEKL